MEISILIVDDDKILVDKLEETIKWKKIGISMVFTAYNIRQAQKILEEFPIQIMLCDIDMPQGSGLELLEWMRSKEIDTECAFLSSYANFAYAQKALRFSCREYLLKPISNHELEQILQKMTDGVRRKWNIECFRENSSNKKAFWDRFFRENTEENGSIENLYGGECLFYLQMVKMFMKENDSERKKKCSLCKFVLNKAEAEEVVAVADNEWVMVMEWKENRKVREEAQELALCLNEKVLSPVSVYVGKPCKSKALQQSWQRLKQIEEEELPRKNDVFMEGEVTHIKKYENPPWEIWKKMMITPQGLKSVLEEMKEYLAHHYKHGNLDVKQLRRFIRELNQFIYVYMAEQKLNFTQVFEANEFEIREAEAYVFYESCIEFAEFLFSTLEGNLNGNQDNAVERVKEYISKNLGKELTRTILAKEVFLSEDYISKLFKSQTGMSLTNYIALQRIEKAKEYLEYSNLTVSKIALEVGFNNFSYFSKTFRDITGMTPNEYKNNKKKNGT